MEDLAISSGPEGAVKPVSFTLEKGGVIWIKGRSGSGKTTVLRQLARLTALGTGRMRLNGVSWEAVPPVEWRKKIAYIHQKAVLFSGTVRENLSKPFTFRSRGRQNSDLTWAEQTFSRLLLRPDIMERDAVTLSVGESARVVLVRALMGEPLVLLPDETTAALDADARDAVVSLMQEWLSTGNRGMIGVSHDETVRRLLPGVEVVL